MFGILVNFCDTSDALALYLFSARAAMSSLAFFTGFSFSSFLPCSSRRMMQVAPSHGYGSYGYTRHNGLNGIDFLSGDFDVGIDGDLLTAGIAAAAAAFFFLTYGAITAGKKKRKKRSENETYTDQASWIPTWITGTF